MEIQNWKQFEGKKNKKNKDIDPYGEEDWNDQNQIAPVNITLKKYQAELLVKLLHKYYDERGDDSCNDPDHDEEHLIPGPERVNFYREGNLGREQDIQEMIEDDGDVWFSNFDFPNALRNIIRRQL